MRLIACAALAAAAVPGMALAAPVASALAAPAARAAPAAVADETGGSVRVAMRQETLPPGGTLPEHRPAGERYIYVIAGRLKVSDLVTGEEQMVDAGKMAAEQPGDWHVAMAVGPDPATFYVIDRGPSAAAATTAGDVGN
jgi:quercetin dioxygenase-like cupin family protein